MAALSTRFQNILSTCYDMTGSFTLQGWILHSTTAINGQEIGHIEGMPGRTANCIVMLEFIAIQLNTEQSPIAMTDCPLPLRHRNHLTSCARSRVTSIVMTSPAAEIHNVPSLSIQLVCFPAVLGFFD